MNDRYADLDESAEWNDAVNRQSMAMQRLAAFAARHPEHAQVCLRRALKLSLQPHYVWPLGMGPDR